MGKNTAKSIELKAINGFFGGVTRKANANNHFTKCLFAFKFKDKVLINFMNILMLDEFHQKNKILN